MISCWFPKQYDCKQRTIIITFSLDPQIHIPLSFALTMLYQPTSAFFMDVQMIFITFLDPCIHEYTYHRSRYWWCFTKPLMPTLYQSANELFRNAHTVVIITVGQTGYYGNSSLRQLLQPSFSSVPDYCIENAHLWAKFCVIDNKLNKHQRCKPSVLLYTC